MTGHSLWLVCIAVCFFGSIWLRPRPGFAVMASTGLLALAFPGTAFGAVAFAVSALAALIDTVHVILSAIRSAKR